MKFIYHSVVLHSRQNSQAVDNSPRVSENITKFIKVAIGQMYEINLEFCPLSRASTHIFGSVWLALRRNSYSIPGIINRFRLAESSMNQTQAFKRALENPGPHQASSFA